MNNTDKRIAYLSTALVLLIAGGTFILSFDALRHYARVEGINPALDWLWALIIDGFIIVASISVLRASRNGETVWYQWLLVGLATVASVYFNWVHIPKAAAIIPPLFLLLSFELAVKQIQAMVQRTETAQTLADMQQTIADAQGQLADIQRTIEVKAKQKADIEAQLKDKRAELRDIGGGGKITPETRRDIVHALADVAEPTILAQAFGVSPKTITRDLAAANGGGE